MKDPEVSVFLRAIWFSSDEEKKFQEGKYLGYQKILKVTQKPQK